MHKYSSKKAFDCRVKTRLDGQQAINSGKVWRTSIILREPYMTMQEPVGILGAGRMGSQIARNLLDDGWEVVAYDIDEAKIRQLEAEGAQSASSVEELTGNVGVLMSSVVKDRTVSELYLGPEGIVANASDGMVLIELSTVRPETVKDIKSTVEAAELQIDVIDAPVIGVPDTAAVGELTVLVGSSPDAFERVTPLLSSFGSTVKHVGPVGTGKVVKLVNNMMIYGNLAVAAEAFGLAQQQGVDPENLLEIVANSEAGSEIVKTKVPKALDDDLDPGFPVDGARKDLVYIRELADATALPLSTLAAVTQQYALAAWLDEGETDYSVLLDLFSKIPNYPCQDSNS